MTHKHDAQHSLASCLSGNTEGVTTSGFVLRRMRQLILSCARADKGFKKKDINQVAKALREYSGEEVTTTQVYNHLRKWRQRWGRVCKLKNLSGALWDDDTKAIMLDWDHYASHVKVNARV